MVAGGYSYSNFDYSDSTIIIDAITGAASQVSKMSIARAYFSLQAIQGTILAVGGVTNAGYTAAVEMFNPTSKAWTLQLPPSDLSLQTPRSAFATIFLHNKTTASSGARAGTSANTTTATSTAKSTTNITTTATTATSTAKSTTNTTT